MGEQIKAAIAALQNALRKKYPKWRSGGPENPALIITGSKVELIDPDSSVVASTIKGTVDELLA